MIKTRWIRFLALFLLLAMAVGAIPAVLAANADASVSSEEESAPGEASTLEDDSSQEVSTVEEPQETESEPPSEQAKPEDTSAEETAVEDDVPRSMDGETLTRDENLFPPSAPSTGPMLKSTTPSLRAAASSTGTVGKSTCVDFAGYTSPYWYCNRYYSEGSHVYGHYFYAATISYHTVDGVDAYCIEPNTSSVSGATYSSYTADSAGSTSYWMRELDATQRSYIQQILAFGYPSVDRGYSRQVQYAATQVLIWEVVSKLRYDDGIQYASSYGLFSAVYATLGANFQACYDAILGDISISNGKAPSFASTSISSPSTVTLTYNSSTNKYEGSVADSNAVLKYFTFAYNGVTFTKSGNTLKISVPASSAASVKGKTITGTSTQKNMATSNPLVWENATYQTVITAGGADYMKAYLKLTWDEPTTPTPTPTPTATPTPDPGSLKIIKACADSSVSLSGWKFSIYIDSVGTTITRTTGSDGTITVTGIPAGSICTVTETSVSGYKVLSSQSCTVSEGKTSTLTFTNVPLTGKLIVTKGVNYGNLSGFTFKLSGTSTTGKSVSMTATTNSSGKATFSNVPVGTYTLSETDPGKAYIKPSNKTVTISANTTTGAQYTTNETMDNVWKYWYATVTKVDSETSKTSSSMAGAEYTLYRNGTKVKTYTVGRDGKFITDKYPCTDSDSVYTLKETKAPEGYQLDSTTYTLTTGYSHYSNATNSFTVTVSDQVIKGKIQVEKKAVNTVSGQKQPEDGATYQVWLKSAGSYASAGADYKDTITIGADGKGTTKDLPYGTYCIQQKTGWPGYELDSTVYEAAITENGATVTKDTSKKALSYENNIWTGELTILKVDGDTSTPLSGAVFELKGSDGYSKTVTTGNDGKAVFGDLVYGVTYEWQETRAPKGYLLDPNNKGIWSVEAKDATIEVTAKDYRRPGSIMVSKIDYDGEPLAGATFMLEYWDGQYWRPVYNRQSDSVEKGGCTSSGLDVGCLTTDSTGIVTFSGLWADDDLKYRLLEVGAPEGYELLEEPAFEGVLPISYPDKSVSAEPDEVFDGTAYFYDLPVTIRDGKTYTLPMTGGNGISLWPAALALMLFGGMITAVTLHPYWFRRNRRSKI